MREYRVKRWTMPPCYVGEHWDGFASAGVGQSRDSDALERANFDEMAFLLGDHAQIVRESHWAVGWVEWLAIPLDDRAGLRIAARACRALNHYPVLSEDRYSEYEYSDCAETWERCYNWRERLDYLRDHAAEYCAGRFREVLAAVRGSWYHASNLLPCPADLIA